MKARPPFPFVVGNVRSGTTLLRAMLDAHPELAIPPESYFVVELWPWRDRYRTAEGFSLDLLADDLLSNRYFPHFRRNWMLDPAFVRERLAGTEPIDFAQAMRRVYRLYADVLGKQRYGDKTPVYVLHMPLLAELFPEARFVHVVRDGRDVALSVLEMPWGPSRLVDAAEGWADRVLRGRADGLALGAGRYRELRYEDLVRDAPAVLRDVCDFLELDFMPEMLRYFEGALERLPERERHQHRHLARPPTPGLRDWGRELPPRDVAAFEAVAGEALRVLGYPRAFPRPPIAARVRAWAGMLLTRLERARKAAARAVKRARNRTERRVRAGSRKLRRLTGVGP